MCRFLVKVTSWFIIGVILFLVFNKAEADPMRPFKIQVEIQTEIGNKEGGAPSMDPSASAQYKPPSYEPNIDPGQDNSENANGESESPPAMDPSSSAQYKAPYEPTYDEFPSNNGANDNRPGESPEGSIDGSSPRLKWVAVRSKCMEPELPSIGGRDEEPPTAPAPPPKLKELLMSQDTREPVDSSGFQNRGLLKDAWTSLTGAAEQTQTIVSGGIKNAIGLGKLVKGVADLLKLFDMIPTARLLMFDVVCVGCRIIMRCTGDWGTDTGIVELEPPDGYVLKFMDNIIDRKFKNWRCTIGDNSKAQQLEADIYTSSTPMEQFNLFEIRDDGLYRLDYQTGIQSANYPPAKWGQVMNSWRQIKIGPFVFG